MTSRRRHSIWRRFSIVVVAVTIAAILSLVIAVATTLGKTTDRIGDLAYAVTGSANTHREVQKMEAASRGSDIEAMALVRRHRSFASQQLRLTLPGLLERQDPNEAVPSMRATLRRVDDEIAAIDSAPTERLQLLLSELEIAVKHVYDIEEARYFDLNNRALRAKATSERFLLLLAGSIGVAGAVLLFAVYRSSRANLRQKAAELAEALAALEVAQADRGRLLDETVRATERERVRLAAELHDGPIQSLAALCLRLDRALRKLRRETTEEAAPLVSSVRDDLGDEVAALRRVMSELRPPALDEAGLGGATRDYVDAFSARTGCASTVTADLRSGVLSEEREVVLYRLVQEALTNVSRHSQAGRVDVELHEAGNEVELRVTDDGVGFDTSASGDLVRNGHYGLAGMRERVEAAGGSFTVLSKPGEGVQIMAVLPASAEAAEPELGAPVLVSR